MDLLCEVPAAHGRDAQSAQDAVLGTTLGEMGTIGGALAWMRYASLDPAQSLIIAHQLLDLGITTSAGTANAASGFIIDVDLLLRAAPELESFRSILRPRMGLYLPTEQTEV